MEFLSAKLIAYVSESRSNEYWRNTVQISTILKLAKGKHSVTNLKLQSPILNMASGPNHFAINIEQKTYIQSHLFEEGGRLRFDHFSNNHPSAAGSSLSNTFSFPGDEIGSVAVFKIGEERPRSFKAFDLQITTTALSPDGKLCAVASEEGYSVKVFSVENLAELHYFTRSTMSC